MSSSRFFSVVALTTLLGAGCADDDVDRSGTAPSGLEDRFVGGWDGTSMHGATVLLLREGLSGTLSVAALPGFSQEYRIAYGVTGTIDEATEDVTLTLGCTELAGRAWPSPTAADDTGGDTGADTDAEPDAGDATWMALDCTGWDLALTCGLAGDCVAGDCNMLCDVTHFGDAYATAEVFLADVEAEFDFWERV